MRWVQRGRASDSISAASAMADEVRFAGLDVAVQCAGDCAQGTREIHPQTRSI